MVGGLCVNYTQEENPDFFKVVIIILYNTLLIMMWNAGHCRCGIKSLKLCMGSK